MDRRDAFPLELLADLEVFLSERHVTRAARRLGVTQSAASQRLAKLRTHFGDPLLVAGSKGLVLTDRARTLHEPVVSALSALRRAMGVADRFIPEESTRRFVLLGGDLLEAIGLPELVKATSVAPRISVSVERVDENFAHRLESGSADLAFVPDFLISPTLRRLPLPKQPFVVLMRKGHPCKVRRTLTLEQYVELDHLLIAPRGLPGAIVDHALMKLGRTRRVVATIQHFSSAPYVVASTNLALTCPSNLASVALRYFPLVARSVPLSLSLDETSMVWHERSHDEPSHRWFRSLIADYLKSDRKSR